MNVDSFLPPNNNNIHILHAKTKFDVPYNFHGHQILKYKFCNVKIKAGIYCDTSNNILRETLDEHISWIPTYISRAYSASSDTANKQQEIDRRIHILNIQKDSALVTETIACLGEYVDLTHPFHQYAFGHLFDTLQKLYPWRTVIKNPKVKFLVNRGYTNIKGFCEQLSALCERSVTESNLVVIDKTKEYIIETLYFGLSPVVPTTLCRETYKWIIERYYNHFLIEPAVNASNLKYKLYCDRNHVKPSSRGVLNNEEVKKYLLDKGFIVLTGSEDFSDIIRYFADAQIIIGAHGSLLANSMFSSPYTKVYEFCATNRIDTSFKLKYKMCQNYNQLSVKGDVNYNITLEINQLTEIINLYETSHLKNI